MSEKIPYYGQGEKVVIKDAEGLIAIGWALGPAYEYGRTIQTIQVQYHNPRKYLSEAAGLFLECAIDHAATAALFNTEPTNALPRTKVQIPMPQVKEPKKPLNGRKVYISGRITNYAEYKEHFDRVAKELEHQGYAVMNPADLRGGFGYEDYMAVCFAMIDVCDIMCYLNGWEDSPGAKREADYAEQHEKEYDVMYESAFTEELASVGEPTLGYVF